MRAGRLGSLRANLARWLAGYRPPLRDWRFWAVQGLVVLVAAVHDTIEGLRLLGTLTPHPHSLSFVPISFFYVPIVYAALNFGFAGSVATAVWCTVLSIPNVTLLHPGVERWGELFQLAVLNGIALFVGQRADRERRARESLEATGAALRVSETKHRGLFETTPVAILVLDRWGAIVDANPAAGLLFGMEPTQLQARGVAQLLGRQGAERLLAPEEEPSRGDPWLVLERSDGSQLCLEPSLTRFSDDAGRLLMQVLLRDVTESRRRQVELQAYATHILRAQEDERKRIAREIHDVAVQELILLYRQLDAVEVAQGADDGSAVTLLRNARSTAQKLVGDLEDFATTLRPPTLEDLGLVTLIRKLVTDLEERADVTGRLRLGGRERRLAPHVELNVFRLAQEALRNVERHAGASQVTLSLVFGEEEIELEVADDGVGFVPPTGWPDLAARRYLGLLGMQERAQLGGGGVVIDAAPGAGTRVRAKVSAGPAADSPLPRDELSHGVGSEAAELSS